MRFPRISFGHLLLVVQAAVIVVLIVWNLKEDATIEVIKEETPAQPIPEAPVTPHAEAIQHIDDDASMALSRVAQLIIRDEGERSRPYLDASGHVTIGVGRNLQSNGLSVSELHSIVPAVDYMHVLRHAQVSGGRIRAGSLEVANRLFPQPLTEDDIMLLLTDDLNVVRKQAQSGLARTGYRLMRSGVRRSLMCYSISACHTSKSSRSSLPRSTRGNGMTLRLNCCCPKRRVRISRDTIERQL